VDMNLILETILCGLQTPKHKGIIV
jgi:hypothetical protein